MPAPIDHSFPVKRPGAILAADWIGDDDALSFEVALLDALGIQKVIGFPLKSASQEGVMCLPNSATILDLSDEALLAHVRMATWISSTVAGSKEWTAAFVDQDTANFQTAIGTVKVNAVRMVSDATIEIDFKKGTSGPTKTVVTDHQTVSRYRLDPEEQVRVLAGAVDLQFPSYVHEHPSSVLSQAQKDAIRTHVLGLALWM